MSLGENLQYLRKKENITQEQLAERLDVSRQSVSKWESDTTYPEMNTLLQLCQMFHCSMDDLVQGNIHDISIEGKSEYNSHMNAFSKLISLGVSIIILGVSVMSFLYGINYFISTGTEVIKEDFASMIFLIFVTIGTAILIVIGIQHTNFVNKNPLIDNFYTQKEIDSFNKKFSVMIAIGVSLILIGVILLFGSASIYPQIDSNEYLESLIMSLFMLFVAIAVMLFIYACIQKSKYNIEEYNNIHDKESDTYKSEKLKNSINGCIMLISTIIYLILASRSGNFGMPYCMSFAVGGICCCITSIILNYKKD